MMNVKVDRLVTTDTVNHQATQPKPEPVLLHGKGIGLVKCMSSSVQPWMLKVKPFDPRF